MRDLAELHELEVEKRHLEPGSPRLVPLAEQIEALATRVMGASMRQRRISERVDTLVEAGAADAPEQSIAATPREIHVILAEWRDTERQLADATPGSPDADLAERRIDRLREEYRSAHESVRQRNHESGPGEA